MTTTWLEISVGGALRADCDAVVVVARGCPDEPVGSSKCACGCEFTPVADTPANGLAAAAVRLVAAHEVHFRLHAEDGAAANWVRLTATAADLLRARVQLYRLLCDAGWSPPLDAHLILGLDARLVDLPDDRAHARTTPAGSAPPPAADAPDPSPRVVHAGSRVMANQVLAT